jgi:anti-anti-sigma factor
MVGMRMRARGHPGRRLADRPDSSSTPHCRLISEPGDDTLVVAIVGELDMAATLKIEPELDRLLAREQARRLVLDLAAVRFLDSAGLGGLLSIRERAGRLGTEMDLVNVSAAVRRILDVSGMGASLRA